MSVRAGTAAAAAALLGLGIVSVPASAAPVSAAPTAAATPAVTVTVDPSYQQPEFQGWGTSLAWLADVTGGYPDPIRKKLVDMLYGADGLNLNIARYNIGGGNATTVKPYLRPGGAVPGFWKAPQPVGPNDKDWWDAKNPAHWDWNADKNQRWWVDQIKKKVTNWEAFSNSPPYFQTVSGYVSGGFKATDDQIRADRVDQFADYLVRVSEELEKRHGIKFDTIEPLNEPNTDYWRTTLGADGQPTGGRQEGAHAGPALQGQIIEALDRRLATAKTKAKLSAPDETNPGKLVEDWYGYPATAQAAVDQINVHTYGTTQRTAVRDIAKAEQRPLWMSEVEGSWGKDFTSMDSGLGMAQRIIDDLRELEPSAWVLWQPVEDAKNMVTEGNLQWGAIHVPFDCKATDTLQTCPIKTNTKFDTIRNFTHYIRPGDRVVKVNDTNSVAAIAKSGQAATVVHTNATKTARAVTLDLSKFSYLGPWATVTPVVTDASGKLVKGKQTKIDGNQVTYTVPAESVTTFLLRGLWATDPEAYLFQSGHTYRIEGVQSGKSLAADATIRTTDVSRVDELWRFRAIVAGNNSRNRYEVTNAATGNRLAVRDGKVVAEATGAADPAAQWVLSTTGDGTYTFINVSSRRLIDVPGQSTTDGTAVGLWQPTSGTNQRWSVRDDTVAKPKDTIAYTVPGRAPVLPATVTAMTAGGEARTLPVTWKMPSANEWRRAGVVCVSGTATDILGRKLPAVAKVTVDTFTATEPGRAKTFPGGTPELPATVVGTGRNGGRADLPVTWNAAPAGAFDKLGVATLQGTATVVDGTKLAATVRVQIAAPTEADIARTPGVKVTATFTENGYSTTGLTNGDTTDKAWSNWKPSGRNASDTLTVSLPQPSSVSRVVVHFYKEGGGGYPATAQAGIVDADGKCVAAGPVVPVGVPNPPPAELPVTAGGATTAVCAILTAVPNGYLTVAELQVYAKAPGTSADAALAAIQVDGVPVAGFNPATTSYRVPVARPDSAKVTATAADPYAEVVTKRSGSRWEITTTSEDGTKTTVYRVELVRGRY